MFAHNYWDNGARDSFIDLCWRSASCLKTSYPPFCQQVGGGPIRILVWKLGGVKFLTFHLYWARAKKEEKKKQGNSLAVQLASWRSCLGGNLNTPNSNHHDFDQYVSRARDWIETKFKVKTYAMAWFFCCQRKKWLFLPCFDSSWSARSEVTRMWLNVVLLEAVEPFPLGIAPVLVLKC